jgi:hypothetical protein
MILTRVLMEAISEPTGLLLHGIKRLRQNLIFGIIALIIAIIAASIMIFSVAYAIMRGELVNPVSVIAPMITVTVFALISSFLYFDGARKLSQWNTSFYFYAKLALILIIISIAQMPIEVLVINSIVSSINEVISSIHTYSITQVEEVARRVQGQVALLSVMQSMISIVSSIMGIILVRILRDLGEALKETISRAQPAGQTPSFALWKLSEATTFLTWSYILNLLSSLTELVSSAMSGIIGLIGLVLYIIGLVRGFGGLSEAESAAHFLKHSGLPLI